MERNNPDFSKQSVKSLLEHIVLVTGMHAVVLDIAGAPAHEPQNHCNYCEGCKETAGQACAKTQLDLHKMAAGVGTPVISECAKTGNAAAALPIVVNGERVATWVLCRYRCDEESLWLLQMLITLLSGPIVDLKKCYQNVGRLAYTDALLDLPNHNQLQEDITQCTEGSFLLLDVLDLGRVNEIHGRAAGDELLLMLRDYLLALNVPGGRLYRITAAKFGLWVQGEDETALPSIAKTLLEKCSRPWHISVRGHEREVSFVATAGILPLKDLKESGVTMDSVASAVSYVMCQAAETGEVAFFDGYKNHHYLKRLQLEEELREAVRHGMRGFSVVYQPFIDTSNALWKGVEALCRWESREFGNIPPDEFIQIAENLGLIGEIGLWVLDRAIEDVTELRLTAAAQFVLDVNLSPTQLSDMGFADKVLELLARRSYPPQKLCLEITESSALSFSGGQLAQLSRMRAAGIQFALDDFGVGYASLSSLYKLPVDIIKTDRSLVDGVDDNPFLQRLFYVMGELAHVNNMKIVAEGVETDAQARVLLMEGADYFQGFRFSKPLAVSALGTMAGRFFASAASGTELHYTLADFGMSEDWQEGYTLPPALYSILNRCMYILFTDTDADNAINRVLAVVGEALHISRACVFMRGTDGQYMLQHSWHAPEVAPFSGDRPILHLHDYGPEWMQKLLEQEMLVVANVATLPQQTRALLESFDVKAIAEFPLLLDGKAVGSVDFNDCVRPRYWAREDVRMLRLLANMLSGVLSKNDLRAQVQAQREKLQTILDQVDALIYVVEPEKGEVLFANKCTKQTFHLWDYKDIPCWEALQGQDSRCKFCPVEKLHKNPGEVCHFEFYNEKLGGFLQMGVSYIQWHEGQTVVLFSAFNINDLINRQQKLEKTATMDPLTNVHNRTSFLKKARQMLKIADGEGKAVTIAFLDVDGLKRENDTRGHFSGDALLRAVVDCLRQKTRSTDLIGRYGGDEFLVLFYACEKENAEKSLKSSLEALARLDEPEVGKYHSFSYGLCSTQEKPYQAGEAYLNQLIEVADARMMNHKAANKSGRGDE